MEKAIEKLQKEMKSKDKYVQVVGTYLIGYVNQNKDFAEHIVKEGRTIAGSLSAMKAEAKKNQSGGVGILTDEEGFEIVIKYFEAPVEVKKKEEQKKAKKEVEPKEPVEEVENDIDDDLEDIW